MEALITSRGLEYFDRQGLRTTTGLSEEYWHVAILKELLDNALDAIDTHPDKRIDVLLHESTLTIADNGSDIKPEDLDRVFDFNVFMSSKRDYCLLTRGAQGNALKTIIGICAMGNYDLTFHTQGQAISYQIDRALLRTAQEPHFTKLAQQNGHLPSAVVVNFKQSLLYSDETVKTWVWHYALCNPDVSFVLTTSQGETVFPAVCPAQSRGDATFIHWYTLEDFETLLHKHAKKHPDKTVKAFCNEFSGTQRILSHLDFPFKRLDEFRGDAAQVQNLYQQLKTLTKEPSPTFLTKYATGKPALLARTGASPEHAKYKQLTGLIAYKDARIPYIIEAFYAPSTAATFQYVTSINNAIPYVPNAFKVNNPEMALTFCGNRLHWCNSIRDVLQREHVFDMKNKTLVLNFICPIKGFGVTDKSKNYVIADPFFQSLLDAIGAVMKADIKQLRKANKRRQADQDRTEKALREAEQEEERRAKEDYQYLKRQLPTVRHVLFARFDTAMQEDENEGNITSTARHLFYKIRTWVNKTYQDLQQQIGKNVLGKTAYNVFTQEILTQKFKARPELRRRVLLAARGFLYDHTLEKVMYLGSREAFDLVDREYQGASHPKWRFNSAVFVEKSTIFDALRLSGIVKDLNFLLVCSQGFSTRAIKDVLKFYADHAMPVYLLSDCDIPGYTIAYAMQHPTDTYDDAIPAMRIGLTVEQVERFGLEFEPYTMKNQRKYTDALARLSAYEYMHLVANAKTGEYRRFELDELNNNQLFTLLRDAITPRKLLPDRNTLFQTFGYGEPERSRVERIFSRVVDTVIDEFYDDLTAGILPESALKRHAVRTITQADYANKLDAKYHAEWNVQGKQAVRAFERHADRTISRNVRAVLSKPRNIETIVDLLKEVAQQEQ